MLVVICEHHVVEETDSFHTFNLRNFFTILRHFHHAYELNFVIDGDTLINLNKPRKICSETTRKGTKR
jgi:hypothetical protein